MVEKVNTTEILLSQALACIATLTAKLNLIEIKVSSFKNSIDCLKADVAILKKGSKFPYNFNENVNSKKKNYQCFPMFIFTIFYKNFPY